MELMRNRPLQLAVAGALGGLLLTTGCTGEASPKKPAGAAKSATAKPTTPAPSPTTPRPTATEDLHHATQICQPLDTKAWVAVPAGIISGAEASILGVSQESIRKGRFGPARCEQAVSHNDMKAKADKIKVAVPGFGEYCLIVATITTGTQPTKDVGVICPAAKALQQV